MITKEQDKELTRLHSQIIRLLYPRCILCRCPLTEPHHIVGRSKSVKWLIVGSVGLCRPCHNHTSAMHKAVKEWYVNKFSLEAYEDLEQLRRRVVYNVDYGEIKQKLVEFKER